MLKTKNDVLQDYQNNLLLQEQRIAQLKKDLHKISLSRLGLFIAEILLVALMINIGYSVVFLILLFLPVAFFLFLVKKQTLVQEKLSYAIQLLWVYQNEVNYFQSAKNGYQDGAQYEDENHPYASDLDIFGPASLYAAINRCNTRKGMDLLAGHFSRTNKSERILQRQQAISEITGHIDQTFHFRAELQNHDPQQLKIIEYKLEHQLPQQLQFARNSFLKIYAKVIPFLTVGTFILAIVLGGYAWQVLAFLALSNAALTFFSMKDINRVYYGFSGGSSLLNSFSSTIRWTEDIEWKSGYIKNLFGNAPNAERLSVQIKSLSSIIQAFDARLNIILSAALNLLLLWDIQCCLRLQKWHANSSDQLLKGLDRISEFEELISIATLKYNHPEWNFPQLAGAFHLEAEKIGHPLIPEAKRVVNDYVLKDQPTVDIITGSNMAGKSTFLRTLGINMVLAYAGAPVCAQRMSLSIFSILSYMRIKDSLNDQTSTFKAELNRLKMILDAVASSENSFVLIDEMLRGTNSKDKYLGSKVFIERLIETRTPSLFATHDLQLSEMQEDYPLQIRNYHFDIQFSEGEMDFDYKIKEGPCKTFNAALLLKEIGLAL
jgi:DNA mismatch repair ATPase MutS